MQRVGVSESASNVQHKEHSDWGKVPSLPLPHRLGSVQGYSICDPYRSESSRINDHVHKFRGQKGLLLFHNLISLLLFLPQLNAFL